LVKVLYLFGATCLVSVNFDFFPQFDELEEMGYIGFSVAFFEEKSQIIGTSSTVHCFTPQVIEYVHALLITRLGYIMLAYF